MSDETAPLSAVRVEPVVGRHDDDPYAEEERYVHEILAKLREDYAKAAQPYFGRLAMIHSLRPMPPLIVTVEQARELGLTPNSVLDRHLPK